MKKNLSVLILSALVMTSASAAVQCGPKDQRVVVTYDTVGAITVDEFQHIDFSSPQSVADALSEQKAHRVSSGTVACQISQDGFHVGAAHLTVPGQPVDYWVPYRAVAAAE